MISQEEFQKLEKDFERVSRSLKVNKQMLNQMNEANLFLIAEDKAKQLQKIWLQWNLAHERLIEARVSGVESL